MNFGLNLAGFVAPFMPTLDLEHGFMPRVGPPDDVVTAFFRAFLPDFYFVNTPISRMRHHLRLIRDLPEHPLILDFHRPAGAGFTELTLCARDDARPGLLSKVAGTLSALKLNIHTAWIHTLRDPHDVESGQRIVLDTLILAQMQLGRARPLSEETQRRVRAALTPVLGGEIDASRLLARSLRRATPIAIHDLTAHIEADGTCRIALLASDECALLFRITRLLARLGLDIAHAQINTLETSASAVFWVTKSRGAALGALELPALLQSLRRALPDEHLAI